MNITNEMIPVCGDFALESFASCLGEESAALEGAITDAKDSVATKISNMKDAVLDKIKKTSKGKSAEALKKDKENILKEQAKVAKAANESRVLLRDLKEGKIAPEDFPAKFKEATEAVRISKSIVGIGSNTELTLQDLQDYTAFLSEAGKIIDQEIAGLESATATQETEVVGGAIPNCNKEISESAIEGVWNSAYSAYERNCEVASEGMNIVRKPLTKQEFQAVFNQEKVREDENLRNAIAHGKYSRTELVDMGLLKEDSDRLGKGEYEQLLVDYEKELKEMKDLDKDARLEYTKKHKLPRHLIHCFGKDGYNSYDDFIKSAKDEKKETKKAEESFVDAEDETTAEESAKVGNYTIVSKPEDLEDEDLDPEEEKQEKMPEHKTQKKAPKSMNKAQEALELGDDVLAQLDTIIELGDAEALAAIEALVDSMDEDDDLTAFEGKVTELKNLIYSKIAPIKEKHSSEVEKIEAEIKEIYARITAAKSEIKYGEKRKGVCLMTVPQSVRSDLTKILAIFEKIDANDDQDIDSSLRHIYRECKALMSDIEDSDEAYADPALAGITEPTNAEDVKNDDVTDIEDAVKKFAEQANVVKEQLVAIKPVFEKDRRGHVGDIERLLKEVENLLPYAAAIADNAEKVKAYDYIAQQRAALQKALDNIPPDISDTEKSDAEKDTTASDMVAAEGSSDDDLRSAEHESAADQNAESVRNLIERNRKNIIAMRNSDNRNDDSLATSAIQIRSQAMALKVSASEDDKEDLEDIITTCSRFISRYGKAIDK